MKLPLLYSHLLIIGIILITQTTRLHGQEISMGSKRTAILIGNQNYKNPHLRLNNIFNDIEDTKQTIETIGFQTVIYEKDLSTTSFKKLIQSLPQLIPPTECILFYYSGHGIENQGVNYLLPTDFDDASYHEDINEAAISLDSIYHYLKLTNCPSKILVIDACRELFTTEANKRSLSSTKSKYGNLVLPQISPSGTYTMFAAQSKGVALENLEGRNSFFTQEFLKNIVIPNITITSIFRETKNQVQKQTKNQQEPCALDNLTNDFILTNSLESNSDKILPTEISTTNLTIAVKTNKGNKQLEFSEGETMQLYFFVNKPCYLRLIYRLADGSLVLLRDDLTVNSSECNQWNKIKESFVCSPPFGYENLYIYASINPFQKLKTETNSAGYKIITEGLATTLNRTIASNQNQKSANNSETVKDEILIYTKATSN